MDATAMYTNIDTDHALQVIALHLRESPDCHNANTTIRALEILMRQCYFRFGDTFFHQTDGTAMGTPPAPSYATLYYGV